MGVLILVSWHLWNRPQRADKRWIRYPSCAAEKFAFSRQSLCVVCFRNISLFAVSTRMKCFLCALFKKYCDHSIIILVWTRFSSSLKPIGADFTNDVSRCNSNPIEEMVRCKWMIIDTMWSSNDGQSFSSWWTPYRFHRGYILGALCEFVVECNSYIWHWPIFAISCCV